MQTLYYVVADTSTSKRLTIINNRFQVTLRDDLKFRGIFYEWKKSFKYPL